MMTIPMNVLRQHWMETDAERMLYIHVFIAEVTNHYDDNLFTIIYTSKYYNICTSRSIPF